MIVWIVAAVKGKLSCGCRVATSMVCELGVVLERPVGTGLCRLVGVVVGLMADLLALGRWS